MALKLFYMGKLKTIEPVVFSNLYHFNNAASHRWFTLSIVVMNKTHYDVLGIKPQASRAELKAAYFKLSKKYHPDVSKQADAVENFAAITDAYEVLSNVKTRRIYDTRTFRKVSHQSSTDVAMETAGPIEPTKMSYGPHMRHPEYITSQKYHATDPGVNYHGYDQWRKRVYHDYIVDRTVSNHKIIEHRDRLANQQRLLSETRRSSHFMTLGMFSLTALVSLVYLFVLQKKDDEADKLRYRLSFGNKNDKNK